MKIWEFYEELNEIVYAVNMDSFEIEYMNRRAREVYGISSLEEVKGKKCYGLLACSASSCAACDNKKLKEGYFLEKMHYHPVIKKKLAMKETMVVEDGKRYRFVLALDTGIGEWQESEREDNEALINEGLRISLSAPTPEESLNVLIEYLGQSLSSERGYIFEETERGTFNNTYEWCANDVIPQKENLQEVPAQVLSLWYQRFQKGKNVIIKNLENIREEDPDIYEYLKPQKINSLVVSPLVSDNEIIGFYGVDNPPEKILDHISIMFQIWGHFIVSLLRRRNLVRRLEEMCFQDQLTGIGNRHAMNDYITTLHPEKSIGILYCDVMGLKKTNDSLGHRMGDQLLIRASMCLKRAFGEHALFRIGGDEFLVLCTEIKEEELLEKIESLKIEMQKEHVTMALGYVWRPDGKEDMNHLIMLADKQMYDDKRAWYAKEESCDQSLFPNGTK